MAWIYVAHLPTFGLAALGQLHCLSTNYFESGQSATLGAPTLTSALLVDHFCSRTQRPALVFATTQATPRASCIPSTQTHPTLTAAQRLCPTDARASGLLLVLSSYYTRTRHFHASPRLFSWLVYPAPPLAAFLPRLHVHMLAFLRARPRSSLSSAVTWTGRDSERRNTHPGLGPVS
jgi:hypothetical protein